MGMSRKQIAFDLSNEALKRYYPRSSSALSCVSLSIEEPMKEKLRYVAEQEQRSLASQIRHLIRLYLQDYEAKYGPIDEQETFTGR